MPSRLRHRVDAIPLTSIASGSGDRQDVSTEVLLAVAACIRAGEVLRFDYGSPDDEPAAPRRAEPHHLVTRLGRWYLVAWDLDRAAWRTFRADRIRPRTPDGPRFAPRDLPGGDVATFVLGRFRGNDGSTSWACQGEAILDLPLAEVQPYVADGIAEALPDGRTRVTLGAWSWSGLVATLLRFDADLEIVGPPELIDALRATAERCDRAMAAR